jgi:predicted DNA-binding transcriptional regulator AlpA
MDAKRARRMVRGWEGVYAFIPYRRTQLKTMVKDGRLPQPVKIGPRAIAFFEEDLIIAQERLAIARREGDSE